MSAEGYMTTEEFVEALKRAAEEICLNICGPVKKPESLKITPPQSYCGHILKTYEDILEHIGAIYYESYRSSWPEAGGKVSYDYRYKNRNFPQIIGTVVCKNVGELTVRNLGCLIFETVCAGSYTWIGGYVRHFRKRFDNIKQNIPKIYSDEDIEKMTKWSEPSSLAAKELGPTSENFVALWQLTVKQRIKEHNEKYKDSAALAKQQFAELSAEMITFLEKIPVTLKYGGDTNCADAPICATIED